jgi:hypothetical protein
VVRWSNWIAHFSGARNAEIIEADTRDVEVTPEGVVFYIRTKYRAPEMRLKKDESERPIPLHSAIIAEGFLDYVRSLPPGRCFLISRLIGMGGAMTTGQTG